MLDRESVTSLETIVPSCPSGLCINKADFLRADFTVDTFFLEQNVKETPLDIMRDDLGIYLKVLRSSMIELINQDYADFVNLSTNLVGLDKSILGVQEPLVTFHQEIQKVNENISSSLTMAKDKLARQAVIRAEKSSLANLQQIADTLAKVERMVAGLVGQEVGKSQDTAERIATDINQLNFAVWRMKDSALVADIEPRLTEAVDQLNAWLDSALLAAVRGEGDELNMSRCCRVYSAIGRVAEAEQLIKEQVIRPQLQALLPPEEVNCSQLGQLCDQLLRVVPEQLAELVSITSKGGSSCVGGFDFLVNSYWTEVAKLFSTHLGHIHSAGNPTEFFNNYTTVCEKFLGEFELHFLSEESLARLRGHESYTEFIAAWNLPLYFQIRFQEVAGPFELEVSSNELAKVDPGVSWGFLLKATTEARQAIVKCFQPDIFLRPLAARFLKLSLQVVSRYKVWADHCLFTYSGEGGGDVRTMKRATTTKDLHELPTSLKKPPTKDLEVPSTTLKKSTSASELAETRPPTPSLSDLVCLHSDVTHLASQLVDVLVTALATAMPDLGELNNVTQAVESSVTDLRSVLPAISAVMVNHLTSITSKLVKGVGDIPRLYRRTNRETPSKPCTYIVNIVEDFRSFKSSQAALCSEAVMVEWLSSAGEGLLATYFVQVSEVLNNVTKMEESLKKLKKVRERSGAAGREGAEPRAGGGLSDDDKIRLQLYLDVAYCLKELASMGCRVEAGVEVKEVVEKAIGGFAKDFNL